MAYIYSFDPGSSATGLAALDTWTNDFAAKQFENPMDAWAAFEQAMKTRRAEGSDILLIENYSSGGHLTKEARKTIGVVDFLYYASSYYWYEYVDVQMRVPQARLSGQREAAEFMGSTIELLKVDPKRKDAFSALSHACAYRRALKA